MGAAIAQTLHEASSSDLEAMVRNRLVQRGCVELTPCVTGVFARPLGNVLYLMVTPMTLPEACSRLLQALLTELQSNGAQTDERRAVVC